ncbi:MAG: LptF/LptG family permease [Candidatus Cloacimonadota bacterium]|nr:LptF/LptG family permease [Candidatus Cloacimonadota bacterium]
MKILDKYILKSFARLYLIVFSSFLVVFIIIEFFEKFDNFLGKNAQTFDIVLYFICRIPYIIVLTSPVAIILAGLFLMQYLNKHNETVAIRSAGISIIRMSIPIFVFGFLISIIIMIFGDTLLPYAEENRDYIKNVKIYKRPKEDIRMRSNIQYKDDEGRLYYIGFLDGYRSKIKHIDISEFNDNNEIVSKITSEYALWKDNPNDSERNLVFHNGYIRKFTKGKLTDCNHFISKIIPYIKIQPYDLVKSSKDPMEMNFFDLREYITRLQRIGEKHQKELVELNIKIAFPFVNLIILFFCIPISTISTRGKSRGIGFVIGIAVCFLYLYSVRLGQSLGYNEIISPLLAAWLANILFGTIGVVGILRAGK